MTPFNVGDTVRVLPPFADSFPLVYTVTEVIQHEDGSTAFILGDLGAFDAAYLEAA